MRLCLRICATVGFVALIVALFPKYTSVAHHVEAFCFGALAYGTWAIRKDCLK